MENKTQNTKTDGKTSIERQAEINERRAMNARTSKFNERIADSIEQATPEQLKQISDFAEEVVN